MRPVVVAYRPDWPTRAGALADELHEVLGASARRIEHIGSTAIPNMAAKDIIDFQVSVVDLTAATEAFADPLAATGFARSPYEHDHVPAGTSDEPTRWAKRLWTRRDERCGDVNLHVRLVGSPNERLALLFRDWFRAHPAVVPAYSAFKLALADAIADTATYAEVKDPIVDLVIGLAEPWAESIGRLRAEHGKLFLRTISIVDFDFLRFRAATSSIETPSPERQNGP